VIEPVSPELGQIDAADEVNFVVNDNELLMVAVNRVLTAIQFTTNPVAASKLVPRNTDRLARRGEDRRRRSGPEQHADRDPLGHISQQIAQRVRLDPPLELEVRAGEPAGDVDR
jgi:hypothetical protein